MGKDIAMWTAVSIVFAVAFGFAFIVISDSYAAAFSHHKPATTTMWTMLGDYDFTEATEWNELFGQPLIWIYGFISTLVLVNLLVAMMADSAPHT